MGTLKIKAQKIGEFLQAMKKIIQVRMRWHVLVNNLGMVHSVFFLHCTISADRDSWQPIRFQNFIFHSCLL